jgi:hypothetical protein
MAKKKILYDESPEIPQEKIDEERDDLLRLSKASLIRRYGTIHKEYKKELRRKDISPMEAHTLAICELIAENNSNLLTLLEHQFGIKFLS